MVPDVEVVIHRVNSIEALAQVQTDFGAEIDLRANGSRIILNHDPFVGGEDFDAWLEHYRHGLLVLNIKEAGIETEVLRRVRARGITHCFLLDVEFPYLYLASRAGERAIAVRYSEDEPIELAERYRSIVDWVWVDTNTQLPLDPGVVSRLAGLKSCLVCPERWGRPDDILPYQRKMSALDFRPDAVMTSFQYARRWMQWDRQDGQPC